MEYHDIIKVILSTRPNTSSYFSFQDTEKCPPESCPAEDAGWSDWRFAHIMKLRQKSLDLSRFSLADFYLSLDADVLLTEPKNLMVVTPMLSSIGLYSNFWVRMSETFYY